MSNRSRKYSSNVLHPGKEWTTRTGLLLLLIAVSVTAADRYDQPPPPAAAALATRQADVGTAGSALTPLKGFEKKRNRGRRAADPLEGERKRRGYYQWATKTMVQSPPSIPGQAGYSVWQPSLQQLTRPYFIPVWGSAGRNPIYFPPQPLNPPFPLDNPRTSYLPPTAYLPPYPPRREDGTATSTTTLSPMWPGDDDDDEDMEGGEDGVTINPMDIEGGGIRFNWGTSGESSGGSNAVNPLARPTRRPKINGPTTKIPSILHGGNQNNNQNGFNNNNVPAISNNPLRPNIQQPQFTRPTQRTTTTRPTTTTRRPTTSNNINNSVSKRPSRCVWAIVSCCTASSGQINFDCFEELGCQGPFWDTNPCDSEVARAAIANALKFYG